MTRRSQYVNFEITIHESQGHYYVEARGIGETQVSGVPFEYRGQVLRQQLERIYRGHAPSRHEAMKAVGSLLYDALFAQECATKT